VNYINKRDFVYLTNKSPGMKKRIIYGTFLFLLLVAAPGCKETCAFCKAVTRNGAGSEITSGSEIEYCGLELSAIKATPPVTVGDNTTKYECR
jgi:hypothetical protein